LAFIQKKISRFLCFGKFTVSHGTGSAFRIGDRIQLANRMHIWIRNTAHEHIFSPPTVSLRFFLLVFLTAFFSLVVRFQLFYLLLCTQQIVKTDWQKSASRFEFFASFPCTRNRNRIPNTVPMPESPNKYGSDRFRFRLRNPVRHTCHSLSSLINFNSPAVTGGWQKYADLHEVRVRLYP
jgi:hypothetical protein